MSPLICEVQSCNQAFLLINKKGISSYQLFASKRVETEEGVFPSPTRVDKFEKDVYVYQGMIDHCSYTHNFSRGVVRNFQTGGGGGGVANFTTISAHRYA